MDTVVIFSLETLNQMVVDGSCHSSTCQISARDFKLWTHSWMAGHWGAPIVSRFENSYCTVATSVVTLVSKVLTHSGPGTGDPPVGRFERKQLSRDRAEQNLRYKVSRTSGQWFLCQVTILGGYLIVWLLKPPTSNTPSMPDIGITKI